MRISAQSSGLLLNMCDPVRIGGKAKRRPGRDGVRQPESSLVLPFPYAGMNQVRFEGCALRPRGIAQPPLTTRPWVRAARKMRRTGQGCKRQGQRERASTAGAGPPTAGAPAAFFSWTAPLAMYLGPGDTT